MLKRRQTQEICDQVREYISANKIIGVHLEPDSMRYYPYGTLAAQLLGFTNTENVGSEGLESYYNSYLRVLRARSSRPRATTRPRCSIPMRNTTRLLMATA